MLLVICTNDAFSEENGNKDSVCVKGRKFLGYLIRIMCFISASPHGGRRLTVMRQKEGCNCTVNYHTLSYHVTCCAIFTGEIMRGLQLAVIVRKGQGHRPQTLLVSPVCSLTGVHKTGQYYDKPTCLISVTIKMTARSIKVSCSIKCL